MTCVVRSSIASLDKGEFIMLGTAGSHIDAVSPCFMKSDGKIYAAARTSGSTSDGRINYQGFNPIEVEADEPVSLYKGVFEYSSGMTIGIPLYLTAGSAGYLETTAVTTNIGDLTTGSTVMVLNGPVAYTKTAKQIVVIR